MDRGGRRGMSPYYEGGGGSGGRGRDVYKDITAEEYRMVWYAVLR